MATSRALVVGAAAAALVVSLAVTASSSDGGWLGLGDRNDATRTTTLHNRGSGPALVLETRRHAPPLGVTSPRRVPGLTADRVDGLHASELRSRAYVYRIGGDLDAGPWVIKSFPGLPPGYYVATFRVVASYDSPPPHDLFYWFTTATQPQAGRGYSQQADSPMVITGSAYVDGRTPFTFRMSSGSNYSILADSSDDRFDSRITFVRASPLRSATTSYQP